MQIGDKVRLHPVVSPPGVKHTGVVVYIHPQRLFYTAEFTFERFGDIASYRESFPFPEREGDMSLPADLPAGERESSRGKYREK